MRRHLKVAISVAFAALVAAVVTVSGQGRGAPPAATGFISGVVQGANGPEAGVWVIAETKDLPTNFIKIVVTDDRGRFMLPELPGASYSVWVRGYGLADSQKQQLKPGAASVTLRASAAASPQEAAKVYPGDYWLSLLEPPAASEFPGTGTGPQGNGIGTAMQSQNHWVNSLKSDCNFCHQLGNQLTRSVDHVLKAKPELKTHAEAWEWRLGTGVRGNSMYGVLTNQGPPRALKTYSDWTERVAKGEVPPTPPRPTGVERNVVLTLWDWGTDKSFMHDEISTDKNRPDRQRRRPGLRRLGRPRHADDGRPEDASHRGDRDPDARAARRGAVAVPAAEPPVAALGRGAPVGEPALQPGGSAQRDAGQQGPRVDDVEDPSERERGVVHRPGKNSFASWFPLRQSGRQASFYDPKTRQFVLIDTCYATHHLQFDNDANETLYFNELTGPIFGWIDTKIFDQTKDEQKAVGWCGQVVDTNGDGKITAPPWNQITARGESILYSGDTGGAPAPGGRAAGGGAPAPAGGPNPKLDTLVSFSLYAVIPSPVDDSVWGVSERYPGYLVRLDRGKNPPQSCITEIYKVPEPGFDPRGVDIDTNGVVWTALAASSHMASFDRRKCKAITGPRKADGSECPEGWTLYQTPGPKLKGTNIPADFHYYNWVDQHNILGLGANKPMATGSNSDSLLVLDPQTRRWVTLRVPYPLGFYSRGLDGRIDDPNGGWKGRALYANYGTHFVWHIEGGKGTKGKLVKFQLRPDPLAN